MCLNLNRIVSLIQTQEKYLDMILKYVMPICVLTAVVLAQIQHIAVIENDAFEQMLPNELKNSLYKTPRIRAALKASSWLGPGEELVYERQAEKIPRSEIYSVLSHAGLIPRSKALLRH